LPEIGLISQILSEIIKMEQQLARWIKYLKEYTELESKKLYLFDFDDTIAVVDAKILVRATGEELSTADYETHKIANPELIDSDYDFSQTDRFPSAIANDNIIDKIREVIKSQHPVAILTGRMDPGPVRQYMYSQHGIVMPVIAVSNPKYDHLGATDAEKKANWIKSQVNHGFNEIIFYENSDRYIAAVEYMANQPEMLEKATISIEKIVFRPEDDQKLEEKEQFFQKKVKKRHKSMKTKLISRGKGKNKPPYTKKPPSKRSKSAPPGAGGS